jgi:hypothetical protein
MTLSRRDILMACASLGVTRLASAQQIAPQFVIAFPALPFVVNDSIGLAVFATESCTVETSLTDVENRLVAAPIKVFVAAPRQSASGSAKVMRAVSGPVAVQMRVFPNSPQPPLVSGYVESPNQSTPANQLRAAENALFVKNPAQGPGYFIIDLKTDADVQLTVKSNKTGKIVHQHTDKNLQPGPDTQIPWDLSDDTTHQRVASGLYAATIVATPKIAGRANTNYPSLVSVV